MSGNFVIWDISTPEIEAIMKTFQDAQWGQLAHRAGTKINNMNKNFPGWDDTTDKVYNDGVSGRGFPVDRNMVPPHNYISFTPNKINPMYGDETNLVQNLSLESNRSFYNWLKKLAIVPISDPVKYKDRNRKPQSIDDLKSLSSVELEYSNTKLPTEILENVKNVLEPNNASTRITELMNAFSELLKVGRVITLEIYSIDGVKISDMRNDGHYESKAWHDASI